MKNKVLKPNIRAAIVAVMFQTLFILVFVPNEIVAAIGIIAGFGGAASIVLFIIMAEAFAETTDYTEAISIGEVDSDPDNDDDNRLGFVRKRARGRNA